MRRLVGIVIPCMAALVLAHGARSAQIVFETVPAPEAQVDESCPAPCFNVQIFFEDPTRALQVQAIQLDVKVVSGGTSAELPVPPRSSAQAANGNVGTYPWNLSATVGKSPSAGFDAMVVNAATAPFTVDSVQAAFDAECSGGNCPFLQAALASSRLYLGRFNATLTGADADFRIGGVTGVGNAIDALRETYGAAVVPLPPPPAPIEPMPPTPPNPVTPPAVADPVEDVPEPPSDPPIDAWPQMPRNDEVDNLLNYGRPFCRGGSCIRVCEGERCVLLRDSLVYPTNLAILAPEPRVGLVLVLIGSLLALRRSRGR